MAEPAQSESSMTLLLWGMVIAALGWLLNRVIGSWDKGNDRQDKRLDDVEKRLGIAEAKLSQVRQHLKLERPSDQWKLAPRPPEESA